MTKPTVLLAFYRPLDLRFMVVSGAVVRLAEGARVVLLAPEELLPALAKVLGQAAELLPLRYWSPKVRRDGRPQAQGPGWRQGLRKALSQAAELAYAEDGRHRNATGVVMRQEFRRKLAGRPLSGRVGGRLVLACASAACHRRALRRLLQAGFRRVCGPGRHDDLFRSLRPDLLVVASAGLSIDGQLMCEARRHGVPVATVVQSWDKTSTKGYPPVHPDYMLVWSEIMKQEAIRFLEMPAGAVFVEGAPAWDHYFTLRPSCNRDEFLARHALAPDTAKVIYVSLGFPAFHEGNLNLLETLAAAQDGGRLPERFGLLFRAHPAYHDFPDRHRELQDAWAKLPRRPYRVLNVPEATNYEQSFFMSIGDSQNLYDILHHCDVCVEISSTQMIEAAIFDKPIVDVAFGRWFSPYYDLDVKDLDLEHLRRIFAVNAVPRASGPEELLRLIGQACARRDGLSEARRRLVEQELPVNRGQAARAVADRLIALASSHRRG